MAELTDTETRLVEDYLWVIDLTSRCAHGLDGGDWYYLADKAQDLARRAERLADTAAEIAQAIRDDQPGPRPRREAVRAAVAPPRPPLPRRPVAPPTTRRGVLMPRITIHVGGQERLEPAISKATPMGLLGTEAIVRLGSTMLTGRAPALRALADALVEAAELADAYDADPDAFNQRERAERDPTQ